MFELLLAKAAQSLFFLDPPFRLRSTGSVPDLWNATTSK